MTDIPAPAMAEEIKRLRAENERLTKRVEWFTHAVHTCHDECDRPLCKTTRERDALRAELERKDAALRGFVRQYDAENPLRTANFHPQGCRCMRCARDAAEATFGPEHKESEPDWFWRDLDPDDSGHTISEALSHVPHGVVCAIHSSYAGPSFFAAVVPVLDPESDNTEEIRADTEDECVAAVKERFAARAALSAQKEEEA